MPEIRIPDPPAQAQQQRIVQALADVADAIELSGGKADQQARQSIDGIIRGLNSWAASFGTLDEGDRVSLPNAEPAQTVKRALFLLVEIMSGKPIPPATLTGLRKAVEKLGAVEQPPELHHSSACKIPDRSEVEQHKRRWSKQEVNEAVRAYRTERQKQYNKYERAIGRASGKKQRRLIRLARKVFGRNVIAAALGCSRGLVSESTTFKAISAQLFFDRQAGKPRMSNRIGMAAAIDQSYKPAPSRRHEADPDPDEELRRLIETQDDDDPPADFEDSDLDS